MIDVSNVEAITFDNHRGAFAFVEEEKIRMLNMNNPAVVEVQVERGKGNLVQRVLNIHWQYGEGLKVLYRRIQGERVNGSGQAA